MESARTSRIDEEVRRRRSESSNSEEERRRKRRPKGHGADDLRHSHRDQTRRRSRSPANESSRRRRNDEDSNYSYRSKRDRSADRGVKNGSSRGKQADQLSGRSKGPLPSQAASFQMNKDPSALVVAGDKEVSDIQKPNFAPTGLLAAASNSIAQADGTSIVLKYHEPAEARKPPPKDIWKLFVFKGADILETIELSLRSCWLVGRELAVVDMPAEHPSISKQHAVIQFRYVEKKNEFGDKLGKVRPYLIDLDSANGTSLNKEGIPPSRYLELRDKDMIQFGHSTREYVLMLSPKD